MAAPPPPPPPPPPPGPSNAAKPDNKKLLASICQGTALKKVPDSAKNDRSAAPVGKPSGGISGRNKSEPLLPPSGKPLSIAEELAARKNASGMMPLSNKPMTIAEEIAAKKNAKISIPNACPSPVNIPVNPKRTGLPLPNVVLSNAAPPPPPPPNSSKPMNLGQLPPPNRPTVPQCPPSQPVGIQFAPLPPPPPAKDSKPSFRPPAPICSKPMMNNDGSIGRNSLANQNSGPIIPPPPPVLPPVRDIRPPKFAPPPPPPLPLTIPSIPNVPIRSSNNFDSRFTFLDMGNFPDVNCFAKLRPPQFSA